MEKDKKSQSPDTYFISASLEAALSNLPPTPELLLAHDNRINNHNTILPQQEGENINNNYIMDDEFEQERVEIEEQHSKLGNHRLFQQVDELINEKKYQDAVNLLKQFKNNLEYKKNLNFKVKVLEKLMVAYFAGGYPKEAKDAETSWQRATQKLAYKNDPIGLERIYRIKMALNTDDYFPHVKKDKNKIDSKYAYQKKGYLFFPLLREYINNFLFSKEEKLENSFKIYNEKVKQTKKTQHALLDERQKKFEALKQLEEKTSAKIQKQQKIALDHYPENTNDSESDGSDQEWDLIKRSRKKVNQLKSQLANNKKEETDTYEKYKRDAQETVLKLEIERQYKVEAAFFNSKKIKNKKPFEFFKAIRESRYAPESKDSKAAKINMTRSPARYLITAERCVLQSSYSVQNRMKEADPVHNASLSPSNNNVQVRSEAPREFVQYEDISIEYKVVNKKNGSKNHLADCKIEKLGGYANKATHTLRKMIGENREKSRAVTSLMIQLLSQGKPITEAILAKNIDLSSENVKLKEYCEYLTILSFGLLREACRRAYPHEKRHEIPYAVLIARGLILAEEGYIHLTDLFEEHSIAKYQEEQYPNPIRQRFGSIYGIFTTPQETPIARGNNIEFVRSKAYFINNKYIEHKIKKNPDISEPNSIMTMSRSKIYEDLVRVFGGGERFDEYCYSSDEEYSDLDINFSQEDSSEEYSSSDSDSSDSKKPLPRAN